jgi:hypothetical protein
LDVRQAAADAGLRAKSSLGVERPGYPIAVRELAGEAVLPVTERTDEEACLAAARTV